MPTETGDFFMKEAAAILNISRNSLCIAVRAGEVESFKPGKCRLITADELAAYAERRKARKGAKAA